MKNILVVARFNQAEALRVAAGLTLLDDAVRVALLGELEETTAVLEQLEVLEFADVPLERYAGPVPAEPALARAMAAADAVYVL